MLTKATVLLFTWFGKYTHYNTQKTAIFMRRTKRRFARSKVYYFMAYYHAKSHSLTRKVATCGCFMSRTLAQFTFDLQYKAMARQLNKTPVSSNERIEWFRDDMFIRRPPEVFTWQCKKHCQNVETLQRTEELLHYSNVSDLYLFLNLEVFQNVHESTFRTISLKTIIKQ